MDFSNYECDGQIHLFDFIEESKYKITKPIRLIECFAGIGSQFQALKNIGANVESHRVIEFDPAAVRSFNAVHGTNYEPTDITKIHAEDLGIVDRERFTYLLTRSLVKIYL